MSANNVLTIDIATGIGTVPKKGPGPTTQGALRTLIDFERRTRAAMAQRWGKHWVESASSPTGMEDARMAAAAVGLGRIRHMARADAQLNFPTHDPCALFPEVDQPRARSGLLFLWRYHVTYTRISEGLDSPAKVTVPSRNGTVKQNKTRVATVGARGEPVKTRGRPRRAEAAADSSLRELALAGKN